MFQHNFAIKSYQCLQQIQGILFLQEKILQKVSYNLIKSGPIVFAHLI